MTTMRSTATITQHNPCWAGIEGTPEVRTLAEHILWFWGPSYRYDPRYKRGLWNGKVSLFEDGFFLAGLIPRLAAELRGRGVQVQVVPHDRQQPLVQYGFRWNDAVPGPLRGYQVEAVAAARSAGRGVLQLATGSGKTEIIARLIAEYDTRTIVVCHTRDLLHQTAERLAARLPNAHVALVGDSYADFGEITVALFQSLSQNIEALSDELCSYRLVIADEAHHVGADSFSAVMARIPAPYRFGFSATPDTGGEDVLHSRDLVLEGHTGPIIYSYSARDAVADGVLVAPHIFLTEYPISVELDVNRNDWAGLYREGIVNNEDRNNAVAQMAATAATEWGKTLVLVKEIGHMEEIENRIEELGVDAIPLHGKMTTRQRKQQLSDFRDEPSVLCMVATGLFDEGVDVPSISAVVLATGGKADHKVMQRIGRGMRHGGKESLVVVDFVDRCHPILLHHSRKRQDVYRREGWEVERVDLAEGAGV